MFLTEWDTETSPITNEGLEYIFQGISDDEQYYVSAEFAVTAPFLPKGSEPDVIAQSERIYLLPHESDEYQSYLRTVLPRLEALQPRDFKPDLAWIEHLIRTMKIQNRQRHYHE